MLGLIGDDRSHALFYYCMHWNSSLMLPRLTLENSLDLALSEKSFPDPYITLIFPKTRDNSLNLGTLIWCDTSLASSPPQALPKTGRSLGTRLILVLILGTWYYDSGRAARTAPHRCHDVTSLECRTYAAPSAYRGIGLGPARVRSGLV